MFFEKLFRGEYNKAVVPIILMVAYFLNDNYGYTIPADETTILAMWSMLTAVITWFVPNKPAETPVA